MIYCICCCFKPRSAKLFIILPTLMIKGGCQGNIPVYLSCWPLFCDFKVSRLCRFVDNHFSIGFLVMFKFLLKYKEAG